MPFEAGFGHFSQFTGKFPPDSNVSYTILVRVNSML